MCSQKPAMVQHENGHKRSTMIQAKSEKTHTAKVEKPRQDTADKNNALLQESSLLLELGSTLRDQKETEDQPYTSAACQSRAETPKDLDYDIKAAAKTAALGGVEAFGAASTAAETSSSPSRQDIL